jgi:hypothetical protein
MATGGLEHPWPAPSMRWPMPRARRLVEQRLALVARRVGFLAVFPGAFPGV